MIQIFETANRKLEQFFYIHDIHFARWYRGRDGLTIWVYSLDEEGQRVLEEYQAIIERRREAARRKDI